MSMQDTAWKLFNSSKSWNIGDGVMSRGDNDIVKPLSIQDLVLLQVLHRDSEVIGGLVIDTVSDHGVELDVLANVFLVPAPLQVIKKNFSWGEGWNGLSKMVFKCVLREL